MSNMIGSTGFRFILLFALVLFASNCGDESEIIIEELDCDLQGFQGGNYEFEINSVSDGCTGGVIVGEFVKPGDQFGPVALPPVDQLPPTIVIPDVPLIGQVEFLISTSGDVIRISASPPPVNVPGLGTITATVSGTLCPLAGTSDLSGSFTVTITSAPLIDTPCSIRLPITGSLVGG